jgi:hypothetical protein
MFGISRCPGDCSTGIMGADGRAAAGPHSLLLSHPLSSRPPFPPGARVHPAGRMTGATGGTPPYQRRAEMSPTELNGVWANPSSKDAAPVLHLGLQLGRRHDVAAVHQGEAVPGYDPAVGQRARLNVGHGKPNWASRLEEGGQDGL